MRIVIETIPHDQHRYPTVGDWKFDEAGNLNVKVSDMDNDDYAFLVGIHECVEAWLCRKRGIRETDVTEFDEAFERMRAMDNFDEPGDDPKAPYGLEHGLATGIERMLASALGLPWTPYNETVESLP